MEAGLACPDWPLCYGTFLPGRQMNLQVFLEWFHRLDAFVVGIALLVQLAAVCWYRRNLPAWLLPFSALLVLMVALQGGLGALTVLQLLPSAVVTAHLALALTLVISVSGLTQVLLSGSKASPAPRWWPWLGGLSVVAVSAQSLLGGRMATSWAAHWASWPSCCTPRAMADIAGNSCWYVSCGWRSGSRITMRGLSSRNRPVARSTSRTGGPRSGPVPSRW